MKKEKATLAFLLALTLLCGALAGCGAAPVSNGGETAREPETGQAALDDPRNQDGIGDWELLVVSFGTSYNDSRRVTIGAIESALAAAFPAWSVRRGFTSQMVIDHIQRRDGISIDNVGQALDRAAANGVKTLAVQPTHLMDGLEYHDLAAEVERRAGDFAAVAMGKPLLSGDEDFSRLADAIAAATAEYDDGETAVCFMGHGTEADSNAVYEKLQRVLSEKGKENYFIGTVEAAPTVEDVLAALRGGNYTKVVLQPLMIVAGDHAQNDMAGDDPDSWKSVFEGAGYAVTCVLRGLGELEDVQAIFADHVRAALASLDAAPENVQTKLRYAERFTIDYDAAGRALAAIDGKERFVIVPAGVTVPEDAAGRWKGANLSDAPVLSLPLEKIYVAASSAMDFFSRLDALDAVRFTSTTLANWTLKPVREAMEAGNILYAGKYSAPDFERLFAEQCPLAIESTMIYHSPDIREQLENLGVPVLVERSSYEPHPLGRMEWIKLYGLLTGREAEAAAFFDAQARAVEQIQAREHTGKSAAFFSISPNGSVSVRKAGDYAAKLIELAGGRYIFADLSDPEESGQSSTNLDMEAFYAGARDADILIYNGTTDGGVSTLAQLLDKNELLSDFKAVQSGNVWCTEQNLFQEPTAVGAVVSDLRNILTDSGAGGDSGEADGKISYFRRVR